MRCFTLTAVIFLSTPSARRATRAGLPESAGRKDFYPRPPRGGRLVRFNKRLRKKQISIHALREEGDSGWRPRPPWRCNFYPRPPRGGRRPPAPQSAGNTGLFLSTPSARRATEMVKLLPAWMQFLSTPSARRATEPRQQQPRPVPISIHALREEGDLHSVLLWLWTMYFYPRPPQGGRPAATAKETPTSPNFYPRPPRGGRPEVQKGVNIVFEFLSTPSARRATAKTETKSLFSNKLYNILHEFRRALIYNGSKNYPNHAKQHKNPVRRCRKNAENSPFAPGRETQNNSRPSCSKGG